MTCLSQLELRAKEIIEIIAQPGLLQLAITYATMVRRKKKLAKNLNELVPQFEELERERKKHSTAITEEALKLLNNVPMNASLLLTILAHRDRKSERQLLCHDLSVWCS